MKLFEAPRIFISLCINMSNMVLEQFGGAAVTASYVHSFVFSPSCHTVWFGHCGFLEMKKLACGDWARGICGMPTMVHCERTADWFEDGVRDVQTRGARRGERGEPGILCCVQPERSMRDR
jgi:hypothetical protein